MGTEIKAAAIAAALGRSPGELTVTGARQAGVETKARAPK